MTLHGFGKIFSFAAGRTLQCGVSAQTTFTNQVTRNISLQECVQITLEHNLDVKIARFDPEIAQQNISVAFRQLQSLFWNLHSSLGPEEGHSRLVERTLPCS